MSFQINSRIGCYQITTLIGAGGMGEVYRAHDTKLNRDVAIKVLPSTFAINADRLTRFRREAQVLASLNHPNIASIYGLEETDGTLALAMEFVDGEDLAERLKRGPIAVDEAIAIAKQIAAGLEAAHEKSVIHRDLKPANIKVTPGGSTKILDFGLAKAFEGDSRYIESGVSQSPTMAHERTELGTILGTAAYMSPEQARGKSVDKRSDIWAFGVVLYEMLTGRRLFDGETVSDTLVAVLTRDPDFNALPANTPTGVQRVLKRCLTRDPKNRLRDIGDVFVDLDSVSETVAQKIAAPRNRIARTLLWVLTAIAIVVSMWTLWTHTKNDRTQLDVIHVDISYPPGVEPANGLNGGFSISPDGRTLAMVAMRGGNRRAYIRRFDQPNAFEITELTGVNSVSFSPDGKSVAIVPGSTQLTRISLIDQQRNVLATGIDLVGSNATWGESTILYNRGGALWMVSQQGGTPRQLTTLDVARHEVIHADPLILPGGSVLFSSLTSETGTERIETVSLETGKRLVLIERATSPVLSPTGHLLFARDGSILAVPFDPKTVALRGSAVPVIPAGIVATVRSGSSGFQVSSTGTLIYVPVGFNSERVISVGRDGSELALNLPSRPYSNPRISPDGRRLIIEHDGNTIEMIDLMRGTSATLIAAAIGTSFSTWTRDGKIVAFRRFNLPFWAAADGSGKSGPLPSGVLNDFPSSPGADSNSIITVRIQPTTSGDIFLTSIDGKFAPKPLIATLSYDGGPQLSPDGHWLLYQSNATGQAEIYVRRYPELDRAWQVSEGGGVQTRWNPKSNEIYYRNGKNMMAVTFDGSGGEPAFGKPVALFNDDYDFGQGISIPNYDVTVDGRFIMLRRGVGGNVLHAVIHWTEELKRILAAGGIH